jgi:hypothetical protein
MKNRIIYLVILLVIASSAYLVGKYDHVPPKKLAQSELTHESLLLSRVTLQSGFQPVDISVPFEKQNLAIGQLQLLADVITNKRQGLYIMRYYDDSLTTRLYVLLVSGSQVTFSVLATVAGTLTSFSRHRINGATYDPGSSTLQLATDTDDIDLSPSDITPVGA